MNKFIAGVVLALLPVLVWADYDPIKIKAGVEQAGEVFQVESWKLSEVGEVWVTGKHTTENGFVLSVGPKDAGIMLFVNTQMEAINSMQRCWTLGYIGLSAITQEKKDKVVDIVLTIMQMPEYKNTISLNNVRFDVEVQEIGGNVMLLCGLEPAQ